MELSLFGTINSGLSKVCAKALPFLYQNFTGKRISQSDFQFEVAETLGQKNVEKQV